MRIDLGLGNPNLAGVVLCSLAALLIWHPRSRQWMAWLPMGIGMLLALGGLATLSRGAWLGFICALAILGWYYWRQRQSWIHVTLLVISIACAVAMASGLLVRQTIAHDASVVNRWMVWKSSLELLYYFPLGLGDASFRDVHYLWFQDASLPYDYRGPICTPLSLLIAHGVPLVGIISAMSIWLVWRSRTWVIRDVAIGDHVLAAFCCLLVGSAFSDFSGRWVFWLIFSIVITMSLVGVAVRGRPQASVSAYVILCGTACGLALLFLMGWKLSQGRHVSYSFQSAHRNVIGDQPRLLCEFTWGHRHSIEDVRNLLRALDGLQVAYEATDCRKNEQVLCNRVKLPGMAEGSLVVYINPSLDDVRNDAKMNQRIICVYSDRSAAQLAQSFLKSEYNVEIMEVVDGALSEAVISALRKLLK